MAPNLVSLFTHHDNQNVKKKQRFWVVTHPAAGETRPMLVRGPNAALSQEINEVRLMFQLMVSCPSNTNQT